MKTAFKSVNALSHVMSMAFAFIGIYYYFAGGVSIEEMSPLVLITLVFSLIFWPVLEIAKHFTFRLALSNNVYGMVASLLFVIISVGATGLGISAYNSSISKTSQEITLVDVDSVATYYDSLLLDVQQDLKHLAAGDEEYQSYGYFRSDRTWALNSTGRDERSRLGDLNNYYLKEKQTALNRSTRKNRESIKENEMIVQTNNYSSWFISLVLEFFTFFMIILILKVKDNALTDSFDTEYLVDTLYQKVDQTLDYKFNTFSGTVLSSLHNLSAPLPNNEFPADSTPKEDSLPKSPNTENITESSVFEEKGSVYQNVLDKIQKDTKPTVFEEVPLPVKREEKTLPDRDMEHNIQEKVSGIAQELQKAKESTPDSQESTNTDVFSRIPSKEKRTSKFEGTVPKTTKKQENTEISKKQGIKHTITRNTDPKKKVTSSYRFDTLSKTPNIVIDTTKGVDSLR